MKTIVTFFRESRIQDDHRSQKKSDNMNSPVISEKTINHYCGNFLEDRNMFAHAVPDLIL